MRSQAPVRGLVAAIAVAALAVPAPAADDLDARLKRLERCVRALTEEHLAPGIAAARAEAIRALALEVLDDADRRAMALAGAIKEGEAGGDEEFYLETGDVRLQISGQVQTRFTWNRRDRDEDPTSRGFEVRRLKIDFNGRLGRDVGFAVGTSANEDSGDVVLQSFTVWFRPSPEWRISAGRARPPLLREEYVSSTRQLAADRSLVTRTFRQDRSLGLMARYQEGPLRASVGIMDATEDLIDDRWRASGRVDWVLAGDSIEPLEDFTSFPDDEPILAVGAGVLHEIEESADPTAIESSVLRWSADVTLERGGLALFASVVGNHEDSEGAPAIDQYGFVGQFGVHFAEGWEVFGRYECGDADGVAPFLSVVTIGINRYLERHAIKWTLDVGYGLNEVASFWSSTGVGWLRDRPGRDGQVVARAQLQLLF
jgi:hypothetical protein